MVTVLYNRKSSGLEVIRARFESCLKSITTDATLDNLSAKVSIQLGENSDQW